MIIGYTNPSTDIWILKGVNLEPSYQHTFFPSGTLNNNNQFVSFYNYLKPSATINGVTYSFHLSNYSFQRKNRDYIRVKLPYELLYDCNYIIFRNASLLDPQGNAKLFYAFIEDVYYVNNNTSDIKYKIDVMQTWFFNYTLNPCFVEREHSATDVRGDNTIEEPIGYSELQTGNTYSSGLFNDVMCIVICATASLDSLTSMLTVAPGVYTCGVYNNVSYVVIPVTQNVDTTRSTVQAFLNGLNVLNRTNNVVSIYMVPFKFRPVTTVTEQGSERFLTYSESIQNAHYGYIQPNVSPNYGTGWTPKNNKMLTYPYCYYTVTNQQGTSRLFKYEEFLGASQNRFEVYFQNSIDPEVRIIPVGYMQKELQNNNAYLNFDYELTIKDFPKCTWAVNDLLAKIVQGGIGLGINALFTGFGLESSLTPVFSTHSTSNDDYMINGVPAYKIPYNAETDFQTYENLEGYRRDFILANDLKETINAIGLNGKLPFIKSSLGDSSINLVCGGLEFIFKEYHVKIDQAKTIDDFFTMYGYATKKVKVPNRNVRTYWTYTKTTNCTIDGYMPLDDADKIQNIYNNGITFWNDLANIGNYGLSNTVPVG